ncbi:MAG: phosphate ABC transporter permease PstA [Acidimicrobiales bacterium]
MDARSTIDHDLGLLLKGRPDTKGTIFRAVILSALLFSLLILTVLLYQVITDGWAVLSTRFGDFIGSGLRSDAEDAGIKQGLLGTFWLALITAIVAFPLGIGAAIYLEEYATPSRLTSFIDINIRNLAGVPSVVYGILGLSIFVRRAGSLTGGATPLAAGLTLAALVLPVVIITSAESIRSVPQPLREAGYGVGATKWEVTRHHVLPYAAPGILTGTLLSLARAAGEAAPLLLVGAVTGRLGSRYELWDFDQLRQRFTAMPIIITSWTKQPQEGFRVDNAAAAIVMLVLFVLLLNTAAIVLRSRFERKRGM